MITTIEKRNKAGRLHCVYGPAEVHAVNGHVTVERWYINGRLHRCSLKQDPKPSVIQHISSREKGLLYYDRGRIVKEEFTKRVHDYGRTSFRYVDTTELPVEALMGDPNTMCPCCKYGDTQGSKDSAHVNGYQAVWGAREFTVRECPVCEYVWSVGQCR